MSRSGTLARAFLHVAIGATAALAPGVSDARADPECTPPSYQTDVRGSTVTICPVGVPVDAECTYESAMLRQDAATGDVVELPRHCVQGCYVDACVPEGSYNYGFAVPYTCSSCPGGTAYYGAVDVGPSDLDAGVDCSDGADGGLPAPYAGVVPWGSAADSSANQDVCFSDGARCAPGCRVGATPTPTAPGASLLALLVGGALMRRRRRRRGPCTTARFGEPWGS